MKTIWKYELPWEPDFTISVPLGAEALHVDLQGDQAFIWVLCDPDAEKTERHIGMFGTGGVVPSGWLHLGTVLLHGYVWHFFERPPA